MPASAPAAFAARQELDCRKHEEVGRGVEITGLATVDRRRVRGENLGALRVIEGKTIGMRLLQRTVRCHLMANPSGALGGPTLSRLPMRR